jgi:hypothetical protein
LAAILRRDGDCCGRGKLALLQLPVLVKYRIALVLVPFASDLRILSAGSLNRTMKTKKGKVETGFISVESKREFDFYHDVFDDLVDCE